MIKQRAARTLCHLNGLCRRIVKNDKDRSVIHSLNNRCFNKCLALTVTWVASLFVSRVLELRSWYRWSEEVLMVRSGERVQQYMTDVDSRRIKHELKRMIKGQPWIFSIQVDQVLGGGGRAASASQCVIAMSACPAPVPGICGAARLLLGAWTRPRWLDMPGSGCFQGPKEAESPPSAPVVGRFQQLSSDRPSVIKP